RRTIPGPELAQVISRLAMGELRWLRGEIVGTCIGRPTRRAMGSGLARWYRLELTRAVVSNWLPVAGPPKEASSGAPPFRQPSLRDVRLRSRTPGETDEELTLHELSIWDWRMRDHREGGGESHATLVGTVYAREASGTRRPAPPEDGDRLDRGG